MSSHLDVLRSQLEAFGAARSRQGAAMECWELQLQLKLAAGLYDVMDWALEQRGRALKGDRGALRDAFLRDVQSLYALWHAPSAELLSVLEKRQEEGCAFDGIGRFAADCEEIGDYLRFDVEGTIEALHDVDAGRTVSIEVLRNELRAKFDAPIRA